jgi:hypothetical protein
MSSELVKKKQQLKDKLLEVAQLEEQIAQLSIKESPKSSIAERFPIGSTVWLTGSNEKLRLRRKKATVTGHTTCYVRLDRKGESFRRAPENITLVSTDECSEETS